MPSKTFFKYSLVSWPRVTRGIYLYLSFSALLVLAQCLVVSGFGESFFAAKRLCFFAAGLLVAATALLRRTTAGRDVWSLLIFALLLVQIGSYRPDMNTGLYLQTGAATLTLYLLAEGMPGLKLTPVRLALPLILSGHIVLAGLLWEIYSGSKALPDAGGFFLSSFLGSRDYVAVLLAQLLPLQLLVLPRFRSLWLRSFCWLGLFGGLYLIFALRARSAWVMVLVIAAGLIFAAFKTRLGEARRALSLYAATALAALAALILMPPRLTWRTAAPYQESLASFAHIDQWNGRLQLWRIGAAMFSDHFWRGIGAGNAVSALQSYAAAFGFLGKIFFNEWCPSLFNDYLQAFAETGVLGGSLFIGAFFVLPAASLWRSLSPGKGRSVDFSHVLLLISCLAVSIDALADFPLTRTASLFAFGACLVLARQAPLPAPKPAGHQSWLLFAGAAGLTVLILAQSTSFALRMTSSSSAEATALSPSARSPDVWSVAFRLWPWDSSWLWTDMGASLSAAPDISPLRRYAEMEERNWPLRTGTLQAKALLAARQKDWNGALGFFSQAFSLQQKCPPALFRSYLHSLAQAGGSLSSSLSSRELGACPDMTGLQWGQTQSFIANWNGQALIAADWRGRFEPYLTKGRTVRPLLPDNLLAQFPETDFYIATPLDQDRLLMTGSAAVQKGRFSLFIFDRKKDTLTRLTDPTRDNGRSCLLEKAALLSWEEEQERQNFAAIAKDGTLISLGSIETPFKSCKWTDGTHLLGIEKLPHQTERTDHLILWSCDIQQKLRCRRSPLLDDFTEASGFATQPVEQAVLSGLEKSRSFYRIYSIDDGGTHITPLTPPEAAADVVDMQDGMKRLGRNSRYWLEGYPQQPNEIIYKAQRIGSDTYSIHADPQHIRTLALWESRHWHPLTPVLPGASILPPSPAADIPAIHEIWLKGKKDRYQAFYFGDPKADKVILWWHGGPRFNVSPRYNPYFHYLSRQGYGILAVNYPGSVGRGQAFEKETDAALADCITASLSYLQEKQVHKIVSWSISAGVRLQVLIADLRLGVTAMIDQAGTGRHELGDAAALAHIPYFSIRGTYDFGYDGSPADFTYPGGHDPSRLEDFGLMMLAVRKFLYATNN